MRRGTRKYQQGDREETRVTISTSIKMVITMARTMTMTVTKTKKTNNEDIYNDREYGVERA